MMRAMTAATDYADMSRQAAEFVVRFIETTPEAVIALPTGETPVGTYDRLIEMLTSEPLDCSGLFFVNLDEYVGYSADDPDSFGSTLHALLIDRHPVSDASFRFLDGSAGDLEEEGRRHEQAIHARGGIDLAILGIGANGHIAFNEPGTSFDSRTHVATLEDSTIKRLTLPAAPQAPVPKHGLTVGIGTILEARSILLLAGGEEKARALDAAFHEPPTPSNPASALQRHPNTAIIADRAALSLWQPSQDR